MWDTRFSGWILDFKLLASILLDTVGKFKFEALVDAISTLYSAKNLSKRFKEEEIN
jgi:hypothetical protein